MELHDAVVSRVSLQSALLSLSVYGSYTSLAESRIYVRAIN